MSLSIEVARKILEASKQRARELRSPVSIAIVDAGGHLVLFERMMSPYGWATGNISIAKATTAVMFNQSTDAVAQWGAGIPGFASSLATMTQGKFIMAAGGWPIRINGATVGGIGVSGGNAPGRDDEIARAGLAAVQAWNEANSPAVPAQPASPPSLSSLSPAASVYMPQQPQQTGASMQPAASYPPMPLQSGSSFQQNFSSPNLAPDQENAYNNDSSSSNQSNQSSQYFDNHLGGQS
ncbi:MAG TPA: heme-binding protein [Ktedonobacteraceae bacterium]|nr:heme-binding protein [Ktedonobacteraceae bacterium]